MSQADPNTANARSNTTGNTPPEAGRDAHDGTLETAPGQSPSQACANAADVTICVTQRERFSSSADSLRSIIATAGTAFELVYIDANSPPAIGREIEAICREHGFTYVRKDEYLSPNRARNIGLSHSATGYVAFVDNDLYTDQDWLQQLLECAWATNAWAVGPIILEGTSSLRVVHMAGGTLTETQDNGKTTVTCGHRYMKQPLRLVRSSMVREPTGYFEFHCVLVRTDVFAQRQFLDEGLMCNNEHVDLARQIHQSGGQIFFEPTSVVRYDTASPFQACDREFFELRWRREWSDASIAHIKSKWGLAEDDASMQKLSDWTARHRQLFQQSQKSWLGQNLPIVARRTLGHWLRQRGLLTTKNAH
ncbi:MAG: glycosyltransferase [Gammaproteobacteria bacterium]|nr:glycosyltransferase [Gammaproteobacteria bacterium]